MASRRGERRRAAKHCDGKRSYASLDEAEGALQNRADSPYGVDPGVAPYFCQACKRWHLGHRGRRDHKTSHEQHDRRAIAGRRLRY